MFSRNFVLPVVALAVAACSAKDSTGRKLADAEKDAVDTCNEWLDHKLHGRLGYISLKDAIVLKSANTIDVGWEAKTPVGNGISMCSTDLSGSRVVGAVVDGLQVQP